MEKPMNHNSGKFADYKNLLTKDDLKNFAVKNNKEDKILTLSFFKDGFKMTVKYNNPKDFKVSHKTTSLKLEPKLSLNGVSYSNKLSSYVMYCRNQIHKHITCIRSKHKFYKGLKYDICLLYRDYEDCNFKYKILKIKNKTRSFKYYYKELIKDWDDEFLKENKWAIQIILDFMFRFNKIKLLTKDKKWIIDYCEYFYFKGFNFRILDKQYKKLINGKIQNTDIKNEDSEFIKFFNDDIQDRNKNKKNRYIKFDNVHYISCKRIGCKNKVSEFIKLFNGEICKVNLYETSILMFNKNAVIKLNDIDQLTIHLSNIQHFCDRHDDYIIDTLNLNVKKLSKINYRLDYTDSVLKLIYKHVMSNELKYPTYLKKRIKLVLQKKMLEKL